MFPPASRKPGSLSRTEAANVVAHMELCGRPLRAAAREIQE